MRNSYKCEINCKKARGIFLKDTFSFQLERRLEKELNLSATAPSGGRSPSRPFCQSKVSRGRSPQCFKHHFKLSIQTFSPLSTVVCSNPDPVCEWCRPSHLDATTIKHWIARGRETWTLDPKFLSPTTSVYLPAPTSTTSELQPLR